MAKSPSKYRWEISIRYVIPTSFDYIVTGDACLAGCRAFFPELKFWYYVQWLPEVVRRAIKFMKKKFPELISVNWLEHATILLSYNALLDAIQTSKEQHLPHPKSFARVDSTTSDTWTRKIAASSEIGKRLNKIICSLLMHQMLGLYSTYLSGR